MAPAAIDSVKAQYEAYPYPRRDPRDEDKRLIVGSPSHWREIDHYVFGGRRDWAKPFRALVAGGGTGDGLVMLAQHLASAGCPAEIVYIDLSTRSREIAEARIKARNLSFTVHFHTGSLLEAADIAPGPYDYIDCCGVLHHLPNPLAGLKVLAGLLKPEGGMGLMLYGTLGRTGVYPLQSALRGLAPEADPVARVAVAKRLLRDLPKSNWINRNPFITSHRADDAALYDLLLHDIDRSYLVPEVHALMKEAGLAVTGFIEPARYDPAHYLTDDALRKRAAAMGDHARQGLAESLSGAMKIHTFYATRADRADRALARPGGEDWIPVWREGDGQSLFRPLSEGALVVDFDGHTVRMPLPHGAAQIAAQIDGWRTVGDIRRHLDLSVERFEPRIERLYAVLNGLNLLLIRR